MALKIFIIAGEASGDWLGAKLLKEIKLQSPDAEFFGVGGVKMEREGLQSIFPMQEISLMGFSEILPHLPNLISRMNETEAAIRAIMPNVVVTIDSPGFNFRIAKRLQDIRGEVKLVHYVAPTVWAYKPKRAAKIAKLFDHLLVILPFEPPYFRTEGLATTYIGHPVTEEGLDKGNPDFFREKYGIREYICMMPGSRKKELERNLPIFQKVAENLESSVVILAADNVRHIIEEHVKDWRVKVVVADNREKAECFAGCRAGLIKSGTSGLEFAFANKPYVVAYKVSPISAFLIRRMIRIPFVNLLNILADKELVKELLQEECTAELITEALNNAINSADLNEYKETLAKLYIENGAPSANAASKVLELAKQGK